ncbi:MAG TPA: phosphatidylglycerol lysyltransferase domain-containing protein, partial [Candidatus Eisenbacteria bacterium]
MAALTALMAVVNLVSGVHPALAGRLDALHAWLPLEVVHGSRLATLLAGFALLLLSRALARRKRIAWGLTLVAVIISIAGHLGKGLDWEEATYGLLLIGVLVGYRHEFHALSDGLSVKRALWTTVVAALFVLTYGTLGFFVLDHHFQVNFDPVASIRQTILMFTSFDNPGLVPRTPFGAWFGGSIYALAGLTGAVALFLLFRPVVARAPATREARERARRIVARHGRSSIARFTLFDDKSYVFSEGGSMVAYVARGGTALALGDPIGPAEDFRGAIEAFHDEARRHDWTPAFYQVGPDRAAYYREAGFELLPVGREAIVETVDFTLDGKVGAPFRTARNRLERAGHHVSV